LLVAVEQGDVEVVKAADETLTNTKWEKAHAKALGEALLSAGAKGKVRVLKALAGLGADAEDALPSLREMLKKIEGKEALPALQVIGKMGVAGKPAGPELAVLVKRDPKVKEHPLALEAAHGLVEIEAMEAADGGP